MIVFTVVLRVQPFFHECALLPSSSSSGDDNDLSLNAPLIYFFFFFGDFTAHRPCMPLIVQKNIIFCVAVLVCLPVLLLPPSISRSSRPQSNLAQTAEGRGVATPGLKRLQRRSIKGRTHRVRHHPPLFYRQGFMQFTDRIQVFFNCP